MKKRVSIFFLTLLSSVILVTIPISHALALDVGNNPVLANPNTNFENICQQSGGALFRIITTRDVTDYRQMLGNIVCGVWDAANFFMYGELIIVLYMVYAGIMYMLAAGDPKKQQAAMKVLNTAIIGFVLVLIIISLIHFARSFLEFDAMTAKFLPTNSK
jgi:hypothetical protein